MINALSLHYTMHFKQNPILLSASTFSMHSAFAFLLLLLHTHNYTMLTL